MLSEQPSFTTPILKLNGDAYIGRMRARGSFAQLTVTRDMLIINASFIGKLVFKPSDILSIEPYGPGLNGVKINHRVSGYRSFVAFSSTKSKLGLMQEIKQSGFFDNKDPLPVYMDDEITAMQIQGAFPIKISAIVIIILVWNILLLPGFIQTFINGHPPKFDFGEKLALGFMILLCVLLLISKPVQDLILKRGRSVDDIKPLLYRLIPVFVLIAILQTIMSRLR